MPLTKHRAQIANQGSNKVARLERIGGSHGRCFLTERTKHATNNFRLPVKINESLLDQARQFQITVKLQQLLRLKRCFFSARQCLAISRFPWRILREDARARGLAWRSAVGDAGA